MKRHNRLLAEKKCCFLKTCLIALTFFCALASATIPSRQCEDSGNHDQGPTLEEEVYSFKKFVSDWWDISDLSNSFRNPPELAADFLRIIEADQKDLHNQNKQFEDGTNSSPNELLRLEDLPETRSLESFENFRTFISERLPKVYEVWQSLDWLLQNDPKQLDSLKFLGASQSTLYPSARGLEIISEMALFEPNVSDRGRKAVHPHAYRLKKPIKELVPAIYIFYGHVFFRFK